jgi:hypothetical protein
MLLKKRGFAAIAAITIWVVVACSHKDKTANCVVRYYDGTSNTYSGYTQTGCQQECATLLRDYQGVVVGCSWAGVKEGITAP